MEGQALEPAGQAYNYGSISDFFPAASVSQREPSTQGNMSSSSCSSFVETSSNVTSSASHSPGPGIHSRRLSNFSRLKPTGTLVDSLAMMRSVLDTLWENKVPGPQLFRLENEFDMEVGRGSQFRVTSASKEFNQKLQLAIYRGPKTSIRPVFEDLSSCVVKKAHFIPDPTSHSRNDSRDLRKELHMQLQSAKIEIEKLCNKSYQRHANIVKLRGWGLCLDTFEALTPLNSRIPLLVLEKATFDLGQFLSSAEYDTTSYMDLLAICGDTGRGLGALHAGNATHGDLKPENILLFPSDTTSKFQAKLCDFGNAVTKPSQESGSDDLESSVESAPLFEYCGTWGWSPPEDRKGLTFGQLKKCDVYVYGLVVWRIFETMEKRSSQNLDGPIDEENILPYREDDQAYKDAKDTIENATNIPITAEDPMVEKRRILAVLRTSLQGDATRREARPWTYLNTARFPQIRPFKDNPIADPESSFEGLMRTTLIPFGEFQFNRIRVAMKTLESLILDSSTSFKRNANLDLLSVFNSTLNRSQRLQELGNAVCNPLNLTWQSESLDQFQHRGKLCYDLSALQMSIKANQRRLWDPEDVLNAYAIVLSKFKICCWQNSLLPTPLLSTLFTTPNPLLLPEVTPEAKEDLYKLSNNLSVSSLAWLLQGEIGQAELKLAMDSADTSSLLWTYTYDLQIKPEVCVEIFNLLVEKGCFVGQTTGEALMQSTSETVLRKFLKRFSGTISGQLSRRGHDELLIRSACAAIIRNIPQVLRVGQSGSTNFSQIFFLTGQIPDQATVEQEDDSERQEETTTTLLHEAVAAVCYPAVDYFVTHSGIPLSVRNGSQETALELAYKQSRYLNVPSSSRELELIIGLLSKDVAESQEGQDLPLGWESQNFGPQLTAFYETTVNPNHPSVTFQRPRFSLLQERRIALGTPGEMGSGPVYKFDLVRFIRKPTIEDDLNVPIFDQHWYKADLVNAHLFPHSAEANEQMTLLDQPSPGGSRFLRDESEGAVVRVLGRLYAECKIILLSNYINLLLLFVPLAILAHAQSWNVEPKFAVTFLAILPIIQIWELCLRQCTLGFESNLDESVLSYIGNGFPELIICGFALLSGSVSWIQELIFGNIICNLLLVPGLSFIGGGIYNTSTGTATGIEQEYAATFSSVNTLVFISASFSTMLWAMDAFDSPWMEIVPPTSLAHAAAIVLLCIFMLWVSFRFWTHSNLFNVDRYDGYEEDSNESQISPSAALLVAIIDLGFMIYLSSILIGAIINFPIKSQRVLSIFITPVILRIGKHSKAISFALQDKADESLAQTLGFTATVVLFVGPVLVLFGWIVHKPMTLAFNTFETIVYQVAVWTMGVVIVNGKSNYLSGGTLLVLYSLVLWPLIILISTE